MTRIDTVNKYPTLYQINTRVWLRELSDRFGRPVTLADIPDDLFDHVASMGFDYIWFLGLWQTGKAGRQVSLSHPEWLQDYRATLPGFTEADVSGLLLLCLDGEWQIPATGWKKIALSLESAEAFPFFAENGVSIFVTPISHSILSRNGNGPDNSADTPSNTSSDLLLKVDYFVQFEITFVLLPPNLDQGDCIYQP